MTATVEYARIAWPVAPEPVSPSIMPYFVCRLSALPASAVEQLASVPCAEVLDELEQLRRAVSERRDAVSAGLFDAVASVREQRGARQAIIRLRRDLFNERSARRRDLDEATPHLDTSLAESVRELDALLARRARVVSGLLPEFERATEVARRRLKTSLASEPFRRGLLASSEALFLSLDAYAGDDPAMRPATRNRVEQGLLRYVTRAAMKATPFATFCTVLPGTIQAAGAAAESRLAVTGSREQTTIVRLNKGLYGALLPYLLQRDALRSRVFIELNPTMSDEPDGVAFLAVMYGRETFQRLPANPLLDVVRESIGELGRCTLPQLATHLARHPSLDSTSDEVLGLLTYLAGVGFLRFSTGIREQDATWHVPLMQTVLATDGEPAPAVAEQLAALDRLAAEYRAAPANDRRALLVAGQQAARASLVAAGASASQWSNLIFMEDASADARASLPETPALRATFDRLAAYVSVTRRVSYSRVEQAIMRHFFDTHYGVDVDAMPLLRFYEDFHREHRKTHLEHTEAAARGEAIASDYHIGNPFGQPVVSAIHEARRGLTALVAAKMATDGDAEEVTVTRAEIAAMIGKAPQLPSDPVSINMFCDFVPESENEPPRLVVGRTGYAEGCGKFYSRFLHLFPDEVTAALRERNVDTAGVMFAEICGDGNFNANLHPPLVPWEISYPTGESGTADEQILVSDIVVVRRGDDPNALALRHAGSGRRIVPVDLGFLNRDSRPALYQLLGRFIPPCQFSLTMPEAALSGPLAPVRHRPRVVFENAIVLARRCWFAAHGEIPRRSPGEPDYLYFVRVDEWRRGVGLPSEVYMRIREPNAPARPDPADEPASRKAYRGMRNRAKPQYVDFTSPMLLGVFEHAIGEVAECTVQFEERYPRRDQLPVWGGERHTAELLVQMDWLEARDGGS